MSINAKHLLIQAALMLGVAASLFPYYWKLNSMGVWTLLKLLGKWKSRESLDV